MLFFKLQRETQQLLSYGLLYYYNTEVEYLNNFPLQVCFV